MKMCVVFNREI